LFHQILHSGIARCSHTFQQVSLPQNLTPYIGLDRRRGQRTSAVNLFRHSHLTYHRKNKVEKKKHRRSLNPLNVTDNYKLNRDYTIDVEEAGGQCRLHRFKLSRGTVI